MASAFAVSSPSCRAGRRGRHRSCPSEQGARGRRARRRRTYRARRHVGGLSPAAASAPSTTEVELASLAPPGLYPQPPSAFWLLLQPGDALGDLAVPAADRDEGLHGGGRAVAVDDGLLVAGLARLGTERGEAAVLTLLPRPASPRPSRRASHPPCPAPRRPGTAATPSYVGSGRAVQAARHDDRGGRRCPRRRPVRRRRRSRRSRRRARRCGEMFMVGRVPLPAGSRAARHAQAPGGSGSVCLDGP